MISFSINVVETLITINATLFLQVVHFLILVFILNRIMLRPVLKLVNDRESYTDNTKNEIEELELKTEQLKVEFISRENAARKDATEERADVRGLGMTKAEEFISESRKRVASIRVKASKEVEAEVNEVQPMLKDQAASLVGEIAEQIIGRRITA